MKKLATLLLLAAACGPGLVEFPVVPPAPGQTPGGGTGPASAEVCGAIPDAVYCGNPTCDTLNLLHCGPNNGICEACPDKWSCVQGIGCQAPTTCPAGQVLCATTCCTGTQLAAGPNDTCAIVGQVTTEGSTGVYCWGANDSGQLGPGGTVSNSAVPVEIFALRGATAVAIGSGHGCAILADQSVKCWGKNDAGQLGPNAITSQSTTPVLVPQANGATAIAVGDNHSCAITADGAVCWGLNGSGQTQGGAAIAAAKGATKIVAGANHTCAMLPTSVVCWGANDVGQVGNGQTSAGPSPVLNGNTILDLAAGAHHTCAVLTGAGITKDNALRCWGGNEAGQIDVSHLNRITPTNVASPFGGQPSDRVIAGRAHTCAFRVPADPACFGDNSFGQLNFPIISVASLVAGGDHNCIIDTTNEIRCFGRNASSELGPFGP